MPAGMSACRGAVAAYTAVREPCSGVRKTNEKTRRMTLLTSEPGVRDRKMELFTAPGLTETASAPNVGCGDDDDDDDNDADADADADEVDVDGRGGRGIDSDDDEEDAGACGDDAEAGSGDRMDGDCIVARSATE